jgi:hypothetical protein
MWMAFAMRRQGGLASWWLLAPAVSFLVLNSPSGCSFGWLRELSLRRSNGLFVKAPELVLMAPSVLSKDKG